ncbi:hypothetical protein AB6806_19745 [Bosea sp. RCC_152_1]|uniref:hypothetical protein n=1 Tax=Bosea sp. RCC_152_1 TaxID=3239228 RepID=UPI003524C392
MAHLVETAKAALRRRLVIYGLWSAGGLLVLFAAGYALDALYTFLMFRWGGVAASLTVAAGLFLGAVAPVLAGYLISRTPSEPIIGRLQDSLDRSPTTKRLVRSKRLMATAIGGALAGAVAAMATLVMLRRAPPVRSKFSEAGRKPGAYSVRRR